MGARDRRRPLRRRPRRDQGWWIRLAAAAVAVVLVGAIVVALRFAGSGLSGVSPSSGQSAVAATGPIAPDFTGIVDWENTTPLTMDALRGKVVLIDFWTYSCINCQRTFPFLRQWWDRYRADGLVIVGVHSPEFDFEKNVGNVRRAIKDYGIGWPVAVDSNMATWNAYSNQYWPAEYLIDAGGRVRHTSFGEGDYDTTERAIQTLLASAGRNVSASGPLASADPGLTADARGETPETYVGSERGDGSVALHGTWRQQPEYAELTGGGAAGGGYAEMPFMARRVFMVAAPGAAGPVTVRVTLDGHDLTAAQAGSAVRVDAAGRALVVIDHDDLYALISLSDFGRHVLRVAPEQPGFQLYTFTFGS
ncbi:MAG TPA: redoxin domain-containing protein [Candidatus Dormibacteraeota bacterium]|nr:redoxin domain-containing protein [Candidatus Dormibacteraeota bacterium]